jgi:hypothetical protein
MKRCSRSSSNTTNTTNANDDINKQLSEDVAR